MTLREYIGDEHFKFKIESPSEARRIKDGEKIF